MGLNLIRREIRTHAWAIESGTGWVNLLADTTGYPYFGDGVFTVQATGCDGVRIYDWAAPGRPFAENTSGTMHTVTAVVNHSVIRVLNPTESTEVTIMSRPLPPPLFRRICWGWLPWR